MSALKNVPVCKMQEKEDFEKQMSTLQKTLQDVQEQMQKEKDQFQAEFEKLTEDKRDLETKMTTTMSVDMRTIEDLKKDISGLEKTNEERAQHLKICQEEQEQEQARCAQLREEIHTLQHANEELAQKLKETQEGQAEEQARCAQLREELQKKQDELRYCEEMLQKVRSESSVLNGTMEDAKQDYETKLLQMTAIKDAKDKECAELMTLLSNTQVLRIACFHLLPSLMP